MKTSMTLVLGSYVAPMVVASFLVFGAAASETAGAPYMRGFIAWCKEEDLKPVFVLPPAAESLRRLFPDSFLQTYVYDFVRDVTKGTDVRFLDYWRDAEFLDVRLYATSLFLNKTGRRRFTARVIADFSKKDMAYK